MYHILKRVLTDTSILLLLSVSLIQAEQIFKVTVPKANIRSGPGKSYSLVTSVKYDDKLVIISSSDGWMKVRTPDGDEGWIHQNLGTIVGVSPTHEKKGVRTPEYYDAVKNARKDAQEQTNNFLWYSSGCLGGPAGILGAYIYVSSPVITVRQSSSESEATSITSIPLSPTLAPNPKSLLGKPPEYSLTYVEEYKKEAQKIQVKNAKYGCLTSVGVAIVASIILLKLLGGIVGH